MNGRAIRTLRVSGDPTEMGTTHGLAHADEIREYAAGRVALSGADADLGRDQLVALAERLIPAHQTYDAALFEEMAAMAESADISLAEAIIVGGYTDFIDVVSATVGGASFEDDCTAVIVPDSRTDRGGFLAQTWDMNASATPHIIMLEVQPDDRPAALVFTTVGTLGQIGMNEAGIAVGINNLTAADGRPGVTWPFVVRQALAQTDFDSAMASILGAELAGGHNFLVFDRSGNGASIEAMPTQTSVQRLETAPLVHTNHCLNPNTASVEGPRPADLMESSTTRIGQAFDLLGTGQVTADDLQRLTRDERSICRHPEPPYQYESCGAAIMRPATGDFWACWGVPSENAFEHFSVSATVT